MSSKRKKGLRKMVRDAKNKQKYNIETHSGNESSRVEAGRGGVSKGLQGGVEGTRRRGKRRGKQSWSDKVNSQARVTVMWLRTVRDVQSNAARRRRGLKQKQKVKRNALRKTWTKVDDTGGINFGKTGNGGEYGHMGEERTLPSL